jgi:hypothetical protein
VPFAMGRYIRIIISNSPMNLPQAIDASYLLTDPVG